MASFMSGLLEGPGKAQALPFARLTCPDTWEGLSLSSKCFLFLPLFFQVN